MPVPLVLVPTPGERRAIAAGLGDMARVELCGFGPVASAARTAALLERHRPDRLLLVGIAGRFDERLAIGSAHLFGAVACFGVGAGSGRAFEPATSLGWSQWPGEPTSQLAGERDPIGDVITCGWPPAPPASAGLLLTACAASADAADVADRRRLVPAAVAEDMEGYGVAVACRLARVPLQIIRGISNTAGDRERSRWRIDAALEAAAALARSLLATLP